MAQLPNLTRQLRSAEVIVRFFMRTIIQVIFATFASIGFVRGLAALLWMSVMLSAAIDTIKREAPFDIVLNHWDEMFAYAALLSLVSVFNTRARFEAASIDMRRL